ncbi:polysaccharide biosynthesis protein [Gordonia hydrophobica]|uniref:Polysaccharide biosynthesis protein n=1 Tax=Gordonia hydrophobica TaxID=40516 RepID=A0ABZ2U682_9ACTN|nr:polysaccharide biosynthesis protein [Gordonia hydrophobica]MBM7365588.1 O-antigen/teichoic acid export membrane protein [Gordonia hydrophobica]
MKSIVHLPCTLVSMVSRAAPLRRDAVVRSVGWVTAGTLLANVLAYVVQVPASRLLGPDGYGEFAVLGAAMLVASVPALALQAVIARQVVRGSSPARLRRLIGVVFLAVAALSVVATLVMMAVARTGPAATAASLSSAAPLAVIAGGQGFLQGAGRFRLLGSVLAAVGILRSVPVIGAVVAGADATGALLAGTLGTVVAAIAVGVIATREGVPGDRLRDVEVSASAVLAASGVQFVMIVAVSVDLLLSRAVLSPADAGVYALGAVATKAAFWLPQAIGVVAYPRLADPVRSAAALRRAVAVLAAIGAGLTVLAAVGGPLVPIVISDDYRGVAGLMWAFALAGALLAVLQLMLLTAIARNRARGALPALAVLVVEVVVIVTAVGSVTGLVAVSVIAAACAVAATAAWLTLERSGRGPDRI